MEDFALAQGIIVTDGKLESATARLVRSGGSGLVRVSDRIVESGRRRFAIAHEVGHWLLHANQSRLLACTDGDMFGSYHSDALESEASIFASTLLMPDHLFLPRVANTRPFARFIKELAGYFGTTLTATALRYVESSEDYCVFVISEEGRIRWWRASRAFQDHELWLDNRSLLPQHSVAAAFFRGEQIPEKAQAIDLKHWLGDVPGVYSSNVIEQAIPFPSYSQVLSLLWLP